MILLYHSIIPNDSPAERFCVRQALVQAVFEHQILWVRKHFRIVTLAEYVAGSRQPGFNKYMHVAITFDDGLRDTFQNVFPFLEKMNVPATIFASTGHLQNGELLWFNYLKGLCFEQLYKTVQVDQYTFSLQSIEQRKKTWYELRKLLKASDNNVEFCNTLTKKYPLTPEIDILYSGMSQEQLKKASQSKVLEMGAHTVTHPYLNRKSKEIQEQEIIESKHVLSELIGKPIRFFAYPAGEYNLDTIEIVRAAGFSAAFAVIPKQPRANPQYEISRIGIYSPSLFKLWLKLIGFANLVRRVGLRVG